MDSPDKLEQGFIALVVRVLLLSFQILAGPLLLAQSEPQERAQFQVGSTEVVVDVIVTDRKGHPVRQLSGSDFRVFEDEVEQKVSSFTPLDDSAAAESGRSPAPGSREPVGPTATPQRVPRLLTVVIDLPDNQRANIKRSCDAVLRYLEKTKTPDTMVAIYYIAGGLRLALPFTSDFREAERSLNQLAQKLVAGGFNRSDRLAIQEEINELQARANPETQYGAPGGLGPGVSPDARSAPGEPFAEAFRREIVTLRTYLNYQNTYQAVSLLVALRALAASYLDLPGRKNVVLFSEGFRYADDARGQLDAVIAAANAANVSFYVIDPAGLGTGMTLSRYGTSTEATQITEIAMEGPGQRGGESKFDRIRNVGSETDVHQQLAELAESTGGILTKNTNDLVPAFAKVLEDGRSFYTLVYQPANKEADGTFRKIRVLLNNKEGYQLRYRQGYWAVPRSETIAMTPAQAHLYASFAHGSLKPAFVPALQANLALAADGRYYVPISVLLPASAMPGEKEVASGDSKLMLVAFARDLQGKIVSTYERHWDIQRSRKDLGSSTITLQAQLPLSHPQPLRVQTIVRLPSGAFAVGESEVSYNASTAPALTSLVVTEQVEQANCEDRSEALCVANVRLRQPAKLEFARTSRLVAYVVVTGMLLDAQTKQPRIGTALIVKNGEKVVSTVRPEAIQALPGPLPDSVTLIAEMGFQSSPPGITCSK